MARKSTAEIKKLLKETAKMTQKDAAAHIGVSVQTLNKWKTKGKTTKAPVKTSNKKIVAIIKALKEKVLKLERELG